MLERHIGRLLGTVLTGQFPAHTAQLVRYMDAMCLCGFSPHRDDAERAMASIFGFERLDALMDALRDWQVKSPTEDGRKWSHDLLRLLIDFRQSIRT